jgi:hypothetical protein
MGLAFLLLFSSSQGDPMKRTALFKLIVLGFGASLWAAGCGHADGQTIHVLGDHDSRIEDSATRDGSDSDEMVTPSDPGDSATDRGGSTADGTTGSDPHYLPPPAIAPEEEPFTCRVPEPLDNFPGINHCIEGYCQNLLNGSRLDCPYGRPEGIAPLPEGVTCRAWTPLAGYDGIFHCIEGYCIDAAHNRQLDCPYGIPEL